LDTARLACSYVNQLRMEGPYSIQSQIIELRQLEQAAQVQFDEAKNALLDIKRRIRDLEKLLTPNQQ